jgi:hypothetical protein
LSVTSSPPFYLALVGAVVVEPLEEAILVHKLDAAAAGARGSMDTFGIDEMYIFHLLVANGK